MEHDINLNIYYSLPKVLWDEIEKIYASMPYWSGDKNEAHWQGASIDLWASVEPSGLQIYGTMPPEIWNTWFAEFKEKLTKILGYEIGEPEDGFEFKYFN